MQTSLNVICLMFCHGQHRSSYSIYKMYRMGNFNNDRK